MLVSIKIYFIISCAFVILIDIDLSRLQTRLVDIYYHIARLDNPIWKVLSFGSKHDLHELFASARCRPTVRIIAFHAIDPGSTPDRRT